MKQTIEVEIPEGWKAIGFGRPETGQMILCEGEVARGSSRLMEYILVERILPPPSLTQVYHPPAISVGDVYLQIPSLPEGFEFLRDGSTPVFRPINIDEYYLHASGQVRQWASHSPAPRLILRKL